MVQAASNQNVDIFEYPEVYNTSGLGINNRGMIVGEAAGIGDDFGDSTVDDEQVGFVYDGKNFYKIVIPGYDVLAARGFTYPGAISHEFVF